MHDVSEQVRLQQHVVTMCIREYYTPPDARLALRPPARSPACAPGGSSRCRACAASCSASTSPRRSPTPAGKALAANPAREATPSCSCPWRRRARRCATRGAPSGNFEIFRAAVAPPLSGEDLYAAVSSTSRTGSSTARASRSSSRRSRGIPWPVALFLWSAAQRAGAVRRGGARAAAAAQALLAMACLLLEVLRAMQNAQSNALVAALIILAFVALERGRALARGARSWRSARASRSFRSRALTFAIPRRRAIRAGLCAAAVGVARRCCCPCWSRRRRHSCRSTRSWRAIEAVDAQKRWFSVMELLHRWTGALVSELADSARGRAGAARCRWRCAATGGTTRASGCCTCARCCCSSCCSITRRSARAT